MDEFNALYEESFDNHDVLGWRCTVEGDRIVEFGPQCHGTPWKDVPEWVMCNGEYLTLDTGEECTPIKDPEWDDIVAFEFDGNEQAARDSYELRVVTFDDEFTDPQASLGD